MSLVSSPSWWHGPPDGERSAASTVSEDQLEAVRGSQRGQPAGGAISSNLQQAAPPRSTPPHGYSTARSRTVWCIMQNTGHTVQAGGEMSPHYNTMQALSWQVHQSLIQLYGAATLAPKGGRSAACILLHR